MILQLNNIHLTTGNYLRELGSEHPFGRICCQTRTLQPTVCDGACGGCKKSMETFRATEPTRIQAQDIIQNAGDAAYEPIDLEVYRENLEKRIARWQSQKKTIVDQRILEIKNDEFLAERLVLLEKLDRAIDPIPTLQ